MKHKVSELTGVLLVPRLGLKRSPPRRGDGGKFASRFGDEVDLPD